MGDSLERGKGPGADAPGPFVNVAGDALSPASTATKPVLPQILTHPTGHYQPSMRCCVQNDVRSVEVAACAAALNSAVVETPYQWADA